MAILQAVSRPCEALGWVWIALQILCGIAFLVMASGRLLVTERGIWTSARLLTWRNVRSYRWAEDTTLWITVKRGIVRRPALLIPPGQKQAVDACWRSTARALHDAERDCGRRRRDRALRSPPGASSGVTFFSGSHAGRRKRGRRSRDPCAAACMPEVKGKLNVFHAGGTNERMKVSNYNL
jgi:hypothetical protein